MNKASNIITIKGQPAAVTFEADINAFRGKFLNVNGYCDFVATSIEALYREGESALDEWMADCEEDGIAPFRKEEEQKRLTLRVPHHIDSRLTIVARQHSISKNQLIVDVLEREFSAQM
ncbi:type II toxin-antitoxin system HicB family antitoxin [Escherichia coli]|nr:type II toxin-antitoxin system HicB family antitoxin [Escherichia coli]EHZ3683672.1 type II toxin-antitoxin system HicB family antitoxin [Escherichia coli]